MDCTRNATQWSVLTPIRKIWLLFLVFVVSFFVLTNEVIAYSFTEDFSPLTSGNWTINYNGGQVINVNGDTVLSSISSQLFPYLYSNSGIIPPETLNLKQDLQSMDHKTMDLA